MTTPPIALGPAVVDRRGAGMLPALARGVELLGELRGSGYREVPGLVRRRDGQTLQLTPLLYRLLAAIDGRRDHQQLAEAVGAEVGRVLTPDDTAFLVEQKLRPLGVLRGHDGAEPAPATANPLLGLGWRYVVTDPARTERVTRPFTILFHPLVVTAVSLAFVATIAWLFLGHGLAGPTHATFTDPRMVLLVVGLTVLSTGFHEFGHAAACRYGGATPGVMGAGLYLVWPAFYTDVSDSYRLGRAGRLRVDLGGLYFNAVFAEAVVLAWWLLREEALLLVVVTQVLQMLRQLVPLVRFDGYHILADVTGVPDLFSHLGPTLAGVLPGRRRGRPRSALKPWARAVVTLWVAVVVPVLASVLVGLVLLLPRVAATAWAGILVQGDLLAAHWAAGEVAAAAVRALSVVTLGLPVLGMAYLLVRVVGRAARRVWRVAGDDPRRRVGAVVTAVVTAAAVALAWWPQGQYEPVAPASQRTVEPVAAPELPTGRHGDPLLAARDRGPRHVAAPVDDEPVEEPPVVRAAAAPAGEPAAATTIAPAKVERPAWPFTWAPPPAAGPEDNRGWAVNTRDGWFVSSVRIDEAWYADGATVAPRNEAWALAQCLDCRTVAVAFQAVFVIGSSDVVTPVNTSVAANEACEACATHAVAVQVVTSLAAAPDAPTMATIRRVLAELEGLRGRVRTMAPEEIGAVLDAAGDRILAIVTDAGLLFEATDGDQQASEQQLGTEDGEEVAAAAEERPGTDGVVVEQRPAEETDEPEVSTEDGVSVHAPAEQPTAEGAEATDDAATGDPGTGELAPEDTATEGPASESPATEHPATEDAATEDPATEGPASEDAGTHDPATEDPATEDPATEDPATQDPATGDGTVATD